MLDRSGSVHKRLFTALEDGYFERGKLNQFARTACGRSREYLTDPWGMACAPDDQSVRSPTIALSESEKPGMRSPAAATDNGGRTSSMSCADR